MRPTCLGLAGRLSAITILVGCAAVGATGRDPHVITARELQRSGASSAYDAIRQLRPEMLRTRPTGSMVYFAIGEPAVAVDQTLVGRAEALRSIQTADVSRIESLSAWHAAKRFGSAFPNGLILVTRRDDPTAVAAE